MIDFQPLARHFQQNLLHIWLLQHESDIKALIERKCPGALSSWDELKTGLGHYAVNDFQLDAPVISISAKTPLNQPQSTALTLLLQKLHPWRKGPLDLFGLLINSEWRCDWKWDRLASHIDALKGRKVLDVGCGNGYYAWRMAGAGADFVLGIDPSLVYLAQFQVFRHYINRPVFQLPLRLEDLPQNSDYFDTVFSMGVLYHRRSPLDHLLALKSCLRPGGQLLLETLVIEGNLGHVLVPEGPYAKMPNVWFIPSCLTLVSWLSRLGYINVRLINLNKTCIEEQRPTEWMHFQSLQHFLDPANEQLTIEGLPAPQRAIFIAEKPE